MTHNHPDVLDTAEWITRTGMMILDGDTPLEAMVKSLDQMPDKVNIRKMVEQGVDSRNTDTIEAVKGFGQMCALPVALPSAVHLVARYKDDFESVMIDNVMAGGDSSARGMLAGFLIGCFAKDGFIPSHWFEEMNATDDINRLIGE